MGGGTGTFTIVLCETSPDLTATIVDFPNVAAIGAEYIADAGLSDRIAYVPGNALETAWPHDQDVILMSYLFSGVPGERHEEMIARAYEHLAPGGHILIHDFVVSADRKGPKLTALWQLQHTAFTPLARRCLARGCTGSCGIHRCFRRADDPRHDHAGPGRKAGLTRAYFSGITGSNRCAGWSGPA
ncbi:MAG: class I SAM-dependent methyltransferase [Alphaproteobacteria bacterium]